MTRQRSSIFSFWSDYVALACLCAADGVNFVLMPVYLADTGYSTAAIGPLVAVLGMASLVSRMPVGALYRPTRARLLLIGSLLVAALCNPLYTTVIESPALLVVLRSVHGLAVGIATTVWLAFFIDRLPAEMSRSRAMGLYGSGLAAGYSLGNVLGGLAGDLLGYGGAFYCSAALWLVALLQVMVTRAPVGVGAERKSELSHSQPTRASRGERLRASLRGLRDPKVAAVMVMSFGLNALHAYVITFFPLQARYTGLNLTEIGFIRGAYSLVNAIGRPLATAPISRFGATRVCNVGFGLQCILTALFPLGLLGGLPVILVVYMMAGGMRALAFSANTVALAEDVPESRLSRGVSTGLFTASQDVAVIVGPLLGSALAPMVSVGGTFLVVPALLILAQVLVTYGLKRHLEPTARSA